MCLILIHIQSYIPKVAVLSVLGEKVRLRYMHVVMDHGQVQKISDCSVCCPWFGFCTVSAGVESIVAVQIFYPILHLSLSQSLVFTSNDSPIAKSVQSHLRHNRVLVLAELLAVLDQMKRQEPSANC